jgi:protein O-mannosyl-transferase
MTRWKPVDDAPHQQAAVSCPAIEIYFARRPWLLALVLAVVTFVAYQPVWHAGFIWDDDDHLTANPAVAASNGLQMIWSSLAVSRYYPLTLTSFWVEHRLWGLNPLPYHLVNVALHAANAFLIFLVLRRLRIPLAWLAAMLWVLHPVNAESVAWITELKNTQSGLFFFLSILCFLRFDADKKRSWYALALACGFAAMLSKPSTVVLPVVLLLCAWWQRGRWLRADIVRIAPFFALAVGMSALTVIEQRGHVQRAGTTESQLGATERLVVAGKAVWFYAAKVLWPARLTFVYPRWAVDASSWRSWVPTVALVVVGVTLWRCRSRAWGRAVLFGGGFFVVALLPVLGFFEIFYFRYSFVADHFQYLACIGLISLAVSIGAAICERVGQWGRVLEASAAAIMLLMLGVSTWRQARIYQDLETLWRDTLAKNPSCWLAHNNLGVALAQSGKGMEAEEHYEEALRYNPDYAEAHNNMGLFLFQKGDVQGAVSHWERALRSSPNYAEAHLNLGVALVQAGKVQQGIPHYEQALLTRPDRPDIHCNLADALAQVGKPQEAIVHYEKALRLKPDFVRVQYRLARLLATLPPAEGGDPIRAISLAQRACVLAGYKSALCADSLATAYAAVGRSNEAITMAEAAIDLARSDGRTQLVDQVEMRLELYRAGQPYR